jgi:anaerobic magnesium-protoporphyrin IX monomethyl ester cyclase
MMRAMDVVLVGPVLPEVENHSLAALAGALAAAGRSSAIEPFFGLGDVDATAERVLGHGAPLVGISVQSTEGALGSLALAWVLRRRGFRGHLVCGGHFATLNAEEILASGAGVDSVVRFAGEVALVGLAAGARTDGELAALPGILWRQDGQLRQGTPGRVVGSDSTPRRGPLPRHLGFPAADLVSSHGCRERCAYCCVAAATALERRELARAGEAREPTSRRPLEALADELAALYRAGARVFNFMDDNLLPLEPGDAHGWVVDLGAALRRRGVGRIAFSLQLRADVVTPPVADALCRLGLVRAYVGIDAASAGQLRALGRRGSASAGAEALDLLSSRGVFAVCNALLVGPTFAFERVRTEIDGLAGLRGAPLHLLPLDVRAGTALYERARSRGLMEGSFLYRRYRFEDRRTELFGRAVLAFPTRLEERSVPIALYDLGYNLGIARRLLSALAATVEGLAAEYAAIAAAWNADQLRILRLAAEAAATGDPTAVDRLIAAEARRVRAHDEALLGRCDQALRALESAAREAVGAPVRAHARGKLLSVALTLGLAACHHPALVTESDAAADAAPAFAFPDLAIPDQSPADLAVPLDANVASVPSDAGCAGFATARLVPPPRGPLPAACAADGPGPAAAEIFRCVTGCQPQATLVFDADGLLEAVESPQPQIVECLKALLGRACYPSLACTRAELSSHCWVA